MSPISQMLRCTVGWVYPRGHYRETCENRGVAWLQEPWTGRVGPHYGYPRESLAIELKQWIDLSTPEGAAEIVKACIALRNNNGGRLVIGFKNDSSLDSANAPADPRASFHVDVIQAIVSRYSAELFAIDVQFYEVDGQVIPVIVVPPGVRTPVAAKADLRDPSGKLLIRDHAVYVRSLQSNNIVSSSEARRGDWDALTRIWPRDSTRIWLRGNEAVTGCHLGTFPKTVLGRNH